MPERGRCSWVDGDGRCAETEDLIRHEPRFSSPRLLCLQHVLQVSAEIARQQHEAAAAPPDPTPTP